MKMFLRGRPVLMLIPDELAPTYSLDTRSELPSCRLKLDWVYPLLGSLPPGSPLPTLQSVGGKSPSGTELQQVGKVFVLNESGASQTSKP